MASKAALELMVEALSQDDVVHVSGALEPASVEEKVTQVGALVRIHDSLADGPAG